MEESASALLLLLLQAGTSLYLFFWDYSDAGQLCSRGDLGIRSIHALALDLTSSGSAPKGCCCALLMKAALYNKYTLNLDCCASFRQNLLLVFLSLSLHFAHENFFSILLILIKNAVFLMVSLFLFFSNIAIFRAQQPIMPDAIFP